MLATINTGWSLASALGDEVRAMERQDFVDTESYAALLRRCGQAKDPELGHRVYAHIVKSDAANCMRFVGRTGHDKLRYLKNLAIDMYGKCGLAEDAKLVFDGINRWNEYSWTMILAAYAQNGHPLQALYLFRKMLLDGLCIDSFILSIVISACGELADLSAGRSIRSIAAERSLDSNLVVATALVNFYGKCGDVIAARKVFDAIDIEHGSSREALGLHQQMDLQGREDP